MIKKIYLGVAALGVVAMLTACQSSMPAKSETPGVITKEIKVVENRVSTGVLIAYLPDTGESVVAEIQDDILLSTAQLIGEVTGGTVYDVRSPEKLPDDFGTVFLGFSSPISVLPEELAGFLNQNDLSEKTIIPFVVTEEGNLGEIVSQLYEAAPESEFLDAFDIKNMAFDEIKIGAEEWLSNLGYNN